MLQQSYHKSHIIDLAKDELVYFIDEMIEEKKREIVSLEFKRHKVIEVFGKAANEPRQKNHIE